MLRYTHTHAYIHTHNVCVGYSASYGFLGVNVVKLLHNKHRLRNRVIMQSAGGTIPVD